MRRILQFIAAASLAGPAAAAGGRDADAAPPAAATAADLLRGMRTERDDVAFTGVRVLRGYVREMPPGAAAERLRVEESVYRLAHADGQTWRSERLEGGVGGAAVHVTIRNGRLSYIGRPGEAAWYQADLPPATDELADLDLVLRNYEAAVEGREEVAGRKAVRVRLRPRWPARPSLALWLDAENHFRLRLVRFNAEGQPVRDHFYERIEFGAAVEAGQFQPPAGARVVPAPTPRQHAGDPVEVADTVDFPVLLPSWLPEGFRPTAARVSTFRVQGPAGRLVPHYRVHLGYGDGVTTISLFETRTAPPPGFSGPHEAVRENELWVLTGYREGVRLVLVGEIGREDLSRMLASAALGRRASRTQPAGAPQAAPRAGR